MNGGTQQSDCSACQCVPGYNGTLCDVNINECSPNPCQNGGTCTDDINSYTCSCVPGYNGTSCETNIDECSPNPCQNDGTCTDGHTLAHVFLVTTAPIVKQTLMNALLILAKTVELVQME